MMDADERLTALKKAYAEMILNTAKEAAARIMVSERKALRFQHELKDAKENALQMLLRLKQTMDSKISEAEMSSFTQQKKIEELEAQLQEAEDIVKDLREELRAVQAEIESFPPIKEVKHPVEAINASEENILSTPQPIVFPPPEVQSNIVPPSDMDNPNAEQINKERSFYNSLFPLKKSYIGNSELPSIILRSKETELYRNGCTQRIRACERTPMAKELSVSEQTNVLKPEMIAKEREGEKLRKAPSLGPDRVCDMEKKEVLQYDSRISSWCQGHVGKRRRRASPNKKKRTPCPSQPLNQVKEVGLAADKSCAISPSSVKHKNDMAIEGKSCEAANIDTGSVRACNVLRTKGEEPDAMRQQKKTELPQSSETQVDSPLTNTESKSSDMTSGMPPQQIKGRVIKYTFQRKRKRGALMTDGNVSTETSENLTRKEEENQNVQLDSTERTEDLKRKEEENQNAHFESKEAISIGESAQEKTCLEQVARQLISLSDRRWWQ